jgi:predicted glycogen debranching enzyme
MADILDWHQRGTRYGIHMASDGLLAAGEPGVQLTWMDARIGDWVVTPRSGKAVEINALWYNALAIYVQLLQKVGRPKKAENYQKLAEKVMTRYAQVFWNSEGNCLFDVVDGERRDDAIRPNQILALSLPFPLLGRNRARQVLKTVEHHLLTPVGLRSLSPQDPDYRPTYQGSPFLRDSAYHQGTVWAWLLGPYLTALVRVRGITGRKQGLKLLQAVRNHLSEAGIGQISEIFDGDAPHTPRGCIAQAWSVAEIGRAYVEDLLDVGKERGLHH